MYLPPHFEVSHPEAMVAAVVGIEIEIDRLVSKFKLSQNKEVGDRLGAVMALGNSDRGELARSHASKGRESSALVHGTGPMHGVGEQRLQLALGLAGLVVAAEQRDSQCAH